jgi:hypothetical protein
MRLAVNAAGIDDEWGVLEDEGVIHSVMIRYDDDGIGIL